MQKPVLTKGLMLNSKRCAAVIQKSRDGQVATNTEAYHQLFEVLRKKDKAIARRYDGLTGSRWLVTVAAQLHDGYITEEDIKDFSEETKFALKRMEILFE